MFTRLAKEAREKAKKLEGRDNISSIIQKKYLEDLAKELEHQLNADFANLKKNLEQDMTQVSESVIDCIKEFEESVGMPISNSWLNVPVDAVEAVQSGKLYAGNWTLSSRIWGMERKVIKDIHTVIAEGIAANKSAYDIAKDLEKYVDPKAKKDWNWSKVYPGTNRKVDYSAHRLARTMVSHAYQFSFVESTKDNPFIEKYKWISSHDKRVCPICKERDGKLFDKDKLPLDHPNGRCTFVSVFEKSATQISDEMAAWVKGKEGDFPKIDAYMKKKFGTDRYEKAMKMAQQGMKQEIKVNEDILADKLSDYVGGGYDLADLLTKEEIAYIKVNMGVYKKKIYRVEESQFTADKIDVGDVFSFDGDLRSFTKSIDYASKIIADEDDIFEYPVIFETVGEVDVFEMAEYAEDYYEDQSEVLSAGKFKLLRIEERMISGKKIKVYVIEKNKGG